MEISKDIHMHGEFKPLKFEVDSLTIGPPAGIEPTPYITIALAQNLWCMNLWYMCMISTRD